MMYHVYFPLENPLPKILTITFNDRLLCSETSQPATLTTLSLEHTFYTSLSVDTRTPNVVQETQRPLTTNTNTIPPVIDSRSYTEVATTYSCGAPDFKPKKTTGLIYGGLFAMRKQFPW